MNEKDIKALIEMVKEMHKADPGKKLAGEYVCENGTVYHFETV